MARKIYLVDTENVGSVWKHLIEKVTSNDKIILFYTENTPSLSYVDLAYIQPRCDKFTLEKCHVGKNALDFQLVSYMGYQLKSSPKTNFFIVSNDSGYDSVLKYWSDKGREITRITTRDIEILLTVANANEANPKQPNKTQPNKISLNETSLNEIPLDAKYAFDDNVIAKELSASYSTEDIQWILEMLDKYSLKELQAIHRDTLKKFGQEKGRILYRLIKPLLKDYYK